MPKSKRNHSSFGKKTRKSKQKQIVQKRSGMKKASTADVSKVKSLREKVADIYDSVDLSTTCSGHCVCCQVACPQLSFSEFLVIIDEIFQKEDRSIRATTLKASIKYFFSNSMIKPCPLLDEKRCSIYDVRPLNCRMYGQWPEDVYEERVMGFVKSTGLKREEVPLNTQCKYVRRIDDAPLTKEIIDDLYTKLDNLDRVVGKFTTGQIGKQHNKRAFHDWYMVTVFGEDRLAALSGFFVAATEEAVEDLADQMVKQLDEIGASLFGDDFLKDLGI